jgi:hypothetical protein
VSVDPSSLIFVVIIGIWAVYLVQHWVRRREQLATSRSVDRFSDAMRILERRPPIPVTLPTRQNRTYVVAPAAAKPMAAAAGRLEVAMKQAPMPRSEAAAARTAVRRRTHRLRALTLLTLLVATPAVWVAHVWGTLYTWPALVVTVALLADLLVVRRAVRRSSSSRRGRAAARRTSAPPARGERAARAAKRFPVADRVRPASAAVSTTAAMATSTTTVRAPEVRPMHSQEAVTEVILLEGEWQPVEVPRPMYTMKAKAERPVTTQDRPLEADSDSAPVRDSVEAAAPIEPAIEIDELDLDSVLDRRRAAGE